MPRSPKTHHGRILEHPDPGYGRAADTVRCCHHFLTGIFGVVVALILLTGCVATTSRNPGAVLYLAWDDQENVQLFMRENGSTARQITAFAGSVRDYAPSPDGRFIAATMTNEAGSDEIWLADTDDFTLRRIHDCVPATCSGLQWAPDSRRLVFEQSEIKPDGAPGSASLWWLDVERGATESLLKDSHRRAVNGRLSADGNWVSFHSPEEDGLEIYNLNDGRSQFLLNEIGTAAAWNPAGSQLVLPQLDLVILHGEDGENHEAHEHDYRTAVHLLLFDPQTGEQQLISGDHQGEDSVPQWSPDGRWIAFGRRARGTGAPRQLWIMRPDGSDARALSDDPAVNHGPPSWSPDGRFLVFQQIDQEDLDAAPSIWRMDVQSGDKELIAASGMQPSWIP